MSPLSDFGIVACMCCLRRGSGEKIHFFFSDGFASRVQLCYLEFGNNTGWWWRYQLLGETMRDFGGGALHRPRPLTRKRCNIGDGSSAAWQARYAGRSPARYIGILSNALHFSLLNAAVELGLMLTVRRSCTTTSRQSVARLNLAGCQDPEGVFLVQVVQVVQQQIMTRERMLVQ